MKHTLLSIIFLAGLTMTACNKTDNDILNRKIVGQYTFEKVTVSDGFLSNKNITDQYDDMVLQLNNKHEAAIIDAKNGITYTGDWSVTQNNNTYTDDDGTNTNVNYYIDIYVSANRGQVIHFEGKNANINAHKMQFKVDRADGTYRYKLNKL